MAGRTALFVARDGSSNGTTPVGARLAFGGLLAGNGASPLDVRAGVLVDNGGALVSGAGDMSYNVRAFRAVSLASAANGPTVGANDASVNVATTAAPGSNSRIDVIWARQHLVSGDGASDSDVIYEIGVTQGTVSASPSAPAVPSGAVALYNATVTSGVTATSGLTFTRVHAWTVANGGVIPVMTSGERSAITPYEGMVIWYGPSQQLQVRNGSAAWESVGRGQANPIIVTTIPSDVSVPNLSSTAITTWSQHATHSKPGTGFFSLSAGVITCTKAGLYRVGASLKWSSGSSGYRQTMIQISGSDAAVGRSGEGGFSTAERVLYLTAGQTLSITARHNNGGSLTVQADLSVVATSFRVEYLGTPAA